MYIYLKKDKTITSPEVFFFPCDENCAADREMKPQAEGVTPRVLSPAAPSEELCARLSPTPGHRYSCSPGTSQLPWPHSSLCQTHTHSTATRPVPTH